MLRVFYVAFGQLTWDWRPVMWGVAILTMVVGTVIAITQTDVKRLLAYSSIAQAGFILTGVIAANDRRPVRQPVLPGRLRFRHDRRVRGRDAWSATRRRGGATCPAGPGLGKRSPLVAGVFALFLLAFAGIPLTSGFIGKFAVFQAAIEGGALPLVIVGVIASAILAFFYVRVIVLMFFTEPAPDGPAVVRPSAFTAVAVGIGAAGHRGARRRSRSRCSGWPTMRPRSCSSADARRRARSVIAGCRPELTGACAR